VVGTDSKKKVRDEEGRAGRRSYRGRGTIVQTDRGSKKAVTASWFTLREDSGESSLDKYIEKRFAREGWGKSKALPCWQGVKSEKLDSFKRICMRGRFL